MGSVPFSGPLAPYAGGFADELSRLGFKPGSAELQLRLAAALSMWMDARGMGLGELDDAAAGEFLAARRADGRKYVTVKCLVPLLGWLRGLGAAPLASVPVRDGPGEDLIAAFRGYLAAERGLQPRVIGGYADSVRPFAAAHHARLREITAADVTAFMTVQSRRLAPKTLQRTATALRSLLRFWHVQGLVNGPLEQAVPRVCNNRPGLPRPLEPGQVRAMLDSCDQATAAGRRDLAMLTLMARAGLRVSEVAGLVLDDISWRDGVITVRGKGGRTDRLPLPADAGQAIAEWLRDGRPATALDRAMFTRIKAPHQALTGGGVTQAAAAAAQRAGLGTVYAHRLRHSAATAVLAAGGSLAEAGQLLRHSRPLTTAGYAKVHLDALRALARPWPETAR